MYIKKLYKENDIKGLINELERSKLIISEYKDMLKDNLCKYERNKIKQNLANEQKVVKKIKSLLLDLLEKE